MKKLLPLFIFLAMLATACGGKPIATTGPAPQVQTRANIATLVPMGTPMPKLGDVARALMRDFANIGPRAAGTPGESAAAQYVTTVFQVIGYSPETQTFTAADAAGKSITSANVFAVKKGDSPREIIVGSHYDSSDKGPGADEASGMAVMLEVARMLVNQPTPYTIRFVAFGATDSGLLGSYAFVNGMSMEQLQNIVAMVDLDHLTAGDFEYAYSDEGQQSVVRDWALEWASGNGLELQTVRDANLGNRQAGGDASDYYAFQAIGIPYVFFESADWTLGDKKGGTQVEARFGDNGVISGTKYDTLDYLDANFPGRVDKHLNLYTTVLYNLLTQYQAPIQ